MFILKNLDSEKLITIMMVLIAIFIIEVIYISNQVTARAEAVLIALDPLLPSNSMPQE